MKKLKNVSICVLNLIKKIKNVCIAVLNYTILGMKRTPNTIIYYIVTTHYLVITRSYQINTQIVYLIQITMKLSIDRISVLESESVESFTVFI